MPYHLRTRTKQICQIILITTVLLLSACNCGGSKSAASAALAVEAKSLVQSYENCEPETGGCTYMRINYPHFSHASNAKLAAKFNAEMRTLLLPWEGDLDYNTVITDFIASYAQFAREASGSRGWYDTREVSDVSKTGRVYTIKANIMRYTGGAHGNRLVSYVNLNGISGEKIELSDIVLAGNETALTWRYDEKLREDRQLADDADLNEAGFMLPEGRFELNTNFAVQGDGLLFYFNVYEIAPYTAGPTLLKLPWEAIEDLLQPEFLAMIR